MPSPTNQQVELQPLHDLALRTDAVEGLQQHGAQQALGRDRGLPNPGGVERLKLRAQRQEGFVGDGADRTRRVVGPLPALQVDVGQQRARPLIRTAHPEAPGNKRRELESLRATSGELVFPRPDR